MRSFFAFLVLLFLSACAQDGTYRGNPVNNSGPNPPSGPRNPAGGNTPSIPIPKWAVKPCTPKPIPYTVQSFEATSYGNGKIYTDGDVYIGAKTPLLNVFPGIYFYLNSIVYAGSALYPGININGYNGSTPVVRQNAELAVDPLANLALPDPSTLPIRWAGPGPALFFAGSANMTLEPGRYIGGMQFFGNGTWTLKPGVYWVEGQIHFVGGGLKGDGVTIFQVSYQTRDDFNIIGNTTVDLKSPETGPYKGLLYYQVRREGSCTVTQYDPCGFFIIGGSQVNLDGVVHISQSRFYGDGTHNIFLRKLISAYTILHATAKLTALKTEKPELLGCLP